MYRVTRNMTFVNTKMLKTAGKPNKTESHIPSVANLKQPKINFPGPEAQEPTGLLTRPGGRAGVFASADSFRIKH